MRIPPRQRTPTALAILHDRPGTPPSGGARHATMPHVLAFVVRLVASAAVLLLAVAWVSPGNPANTFGRAVVVSIVLSIAYYITLARFLWFLVLPWLLYVVIWLAVVMGNYGVGFWQALLLALALAFLSWLVSAIFGVRTFRSDRD